MAFDAHEKDPGWQYLRRSREQILQDQSTPYDSKKNVWIPDPEEGYIAAEIKSTKSNMATVVTFKGDEKTLKKDILQEMNPPKFEKTEDMSNLTFLNDASVLHNLRARYGVMLIYTYSGLFCVVINPYKRLPIYTESVATMYMGKRRTEMPPHLFAVSDEAYRNMLQNHENQSMLITGESGAGKTENTKKVIAYFATVGASQKAAKTGEKVVTLEDQIVQTNPVLEAFGNAKTVRNNNSSRFGKFIRIMFNRQGKLASCDIEHYLLEKSRVIRQAPGERCYHIFYQIFSGFIPDLIKQLQLDRPLADYWFVAQAELAIDGVDDKEEHQMTDEAFDILKFSPQEKLDCYRIISAHLHIGIMKFKQRPREEQAEPDGDDEAKKAAAMYGVDHEHLLKALTTPRVRVGTEWVNKGQNVDQVLWAVGAVGKAIYARMFHWLVKKCNITLDQKGLDRDYFIGVLDIAGFEIFDAEAHFAMLHYAGTVRYNVTNWLEKNKDPLNDTLVACLKATKANALMNELWADYQTQEEAAEAAKAGQARKGGKSGSFMTVSMMYRESLNKLMTMLHKTHPHFIRCIIPNEKKASGVIDAALVLNQLTCNGVLEGIRICRKGFPNRTLHPDFVQRYAILAAKEARANIKDPKVSSGAMLQKLVNNKQLTEEQFRIGYTKVFFKAGIVAHLEDIRDEKLAEIMTQFQSRIRHFFAMEQFHDRKRQLNAYIVVQKNIRSWSVLRTWDWYLLYGKIKPMLTWGKRQEEIERMSKEIKVLEVDAAKAEAERKAVEDKYNEMNAQKMKLLEQLEMSKGGNAAVMDRLNKLNGAKADLEKSLADAHDRISDQEERNNELNKQKRKAAQEVEQINKQIQEVEGQLARTEQEKQAKEQQVRALQDEMNGQDEAISKLNKDKKQNEEANRKLTDDLTAAEAKNVQALRIKQKLEQTLDELEEGVERERRIRSETEKAKRKVEGELKSAQEAIDEISKIKLESDASLKKKEADIHALAVRLEDEHNLSNRLYRQSKENGTRIGELEDELENERQSRAKADRSRGELQRELDELHERLNEQAQQTTNISEGNKKKDSEIIRIRRELDDRNISNEDTLNAQRKRNNDQVAELTETLEQLQKAKVKAEKDRLATQKQFDDTTTQLDIETKNRFEQERLAKTYEIQVAELQQKVDEQNRQIGDFSSTKGRLQNDNADLVRHLEELEIQYAALNRAKAGLASQLEEAKKSAEEEIRERQELNATCKNIEHEIEQLHDALEEEATAKSEYTRGVSKVTAEISHWKARYEGEGLIGADELDEIKRKQIARHCDLQDAISAANLKLNALEKARGRLIQDAEDSRADVDRHLTVIASLEKRQTAFNKVVDEWKKKVDALHHEVEAVNRDGRNSSSEVFKLRSTMDTLNDTVEQLRRENKHLNQEIRDLNEQIGQGGRSMHDVQKHVKRLEVEKDELEKALSDAEAALEAEEAKVLRQQVEVQQIRSEIEKRIQEKEDEFESTRKNHQRAIESIQASLDTETKSKQELQRVKKGLEADINQLEIALDGANKANVDAQKNLKRLFDQVKELQTQVDEEQRKREELRENYLTAEKRLAASLSENEEFAGRIVGSERSRQQLELDAQDLKSQNIELTGQNAGLTAIKRKLDQDGQIARAEVDEAVNELKNSEERSRRAQIDAQRLSDELRSEQEHTQHIDRIRAGLEIQIRDLNIKISEAENALHKSSQKALAKVEERARAAEIELKTEQRRHQEAIKNVQRSERRVRELQFQVEEDKKAFDKLQELVEKLQGKLRVQKRQIEEAEEVASTNMSKFKQIQIMLENAEERADVAENSLVRFNTHKRIQSKVAAAK